MPWKNYSVSDVKAKEQAKASLDGRAVLLQAQQPFLTKRMEACLEDTTVSATIAKGKSKEAIRKAKERFEVLYWGPSKLTADDAANKAMTSFERCIQPNVPCANVEQLSAEIADACKESLTESWQAKKVTNLNVEFR